MFLPFLWTGNLGKHRFYPLFAYLEVISRNGIFPCLGNIWAPNQFCFICLLMCHLYQNYYLCVQCPNHMTSVLYAFIWLYVFIKKEYSKAKILIQNTQNDWNSPFLCNLYHFSCKLGSILGIEWNDLFLWPFLWTGNPGKYSVLSSCAHFSCSSWNSIFSS